MLTVLIAAASLGAAAAVSPVVRQERAVIVSGAPETWRLEWARPPQPLCQDEPEGLVTCPCAGFAAGEIGELWLVRIRAGKPEQRLSLARFFEDGDGAALQRFEPAAFYAAQTDAARAKLPQVEVMKISAYGGAVGFVLQIGNLACGHQPSVLIGVTPGRDELHAIGTVENKERPVVLEKPASWELLRKDGQVESLEVTCGDHGSDIERVVALRSDAKGLHGTWAEYGCGDDGKRGEKRASGALGE